MCLLLEGRRVLAHARSNGYRGERQDAGTARLFGSGPRIARVCCGSLGGHLPDQAGAARMRAHRREWAQDERDCGFTRDGAHEHGQGRSVSTGSSRGLRPAAAGRPRPQHPHTVIGLGRRTYLANRGRTQVPRRTAVGSAMPVLVLAGALRSRAAVVPGSRDSTLGRRMAYQIPRHGTPVPDDYQANPARKLCGGCAATFCARTDLRGGHLAQYWSCVRRGEARADGWSYHGLQAGHALGRTAPVQVAEVLLGLT